MFQTEVENEPSFWSYLLQQLAVPLVPWLLALLVLSRLTTDDAWLLDFIMSAAIGFWCGYLFGRTLPGAIPMGQLVWTLPSFFFLLGLCLNGIEQGFSRNMQDFFSPRKGPTKASLR